MHWSSTIHSTETQNASPRLSPTHWVNSEKHGQSGWIQDRAPSSGEWACSSWGVQRRDGNQPPPYSPSSKKSHSKSFAGWRSLASIPASGYPLDDWVCCQSDGQDAAREG